MTQDERDQQFGRNGRKLEEARRRLAALKVKGLELADLYVAIANLLRTHPSEASSVISSNANMRSPIDGFSAADWYNAVNVEKLNDFAAQVGSAEAEVNELARRYEKLK